MMDELDEPVAAVVIPAHNEALVITRLLAQLAAPGGDGGIEIIVVCNGCTDATAELARRSSASIRVIELTEPSKRIALERGNEAATTFPRVYIDADVEISRASIIHLVDALSDGTHLASAPRRTIPRARSSRLVRWYYDVWEDLPQVRTGLFGRGVIALSEVGFERVQRLPDLMGDDLVANEAFSPTERVVVDRAEVTVWPPRTIGDLVRRRVRAATGNLQADEHGVRRAASVTAPRDLISMAIERPAQAPRIAWFVGVAIVARFFARRAIKASDFNTWLRDESSRVPGDGSAG